MEVKKISILEKLLTGSEVMLISGESNKIHGNLPKWEVVMVK